MNDEERREQYANLPIPTYEEAISRPSSSANEFRGPSEISDDAERQGLLGQGAGQPTSGRSRPGGYHAPTVESARSSLDSDLSVPDMVEEGDARRQVEEFDYLEPGEDEDGSRRQARMYHRARIRNKFTQQLSSIGATLSSFRMPSFRSLYAPVATGGDEEAPTQAPRSWTSRMREHMRIPEHMKMSAPTFARLCGLFTIGALIWILFALDVFPSTMRGGMSMHFDPESVRSYVQEHIDAESIQGYLYHITSYDHVAGTKGDRYLAEWMRERWLEQGFMDDVALLEYYVYLNWPKKDGRSVKIVGPGDRSWKAKLEEDPVYPNYNHDSDHTRRVQTLAWHGHSRSGVAEGPLIYARGGSREDFAWLKDNGVDVNGTIALVRNLATPGDLALKVVAAQEAGCVGVLMYSDPADDGAAKGEVWPNGPWRPADSLQRGAVSLLNWVVGDPLTPGWASTLESERLSKDDNPGLVNIPSLPLAWRDAQVLISALKPHGAQAPKEWIGGSPGFTSAWTTGSATAKNNPIVRLENDNDEELLQPIYNLHGLLQGIESPEKKIIVGNHRDSWCFGAVDPGSGSAIMMELVSIFGELRKLGWRPLRTIEFASWDAEEYNLVGSTEYVEDNMDYLRDNAIAYLNVDTGVFGPNFHAAGSPMLQRPLLHVLDRVTDPGTNLSTLRHIWDERKSKLEGLGAGSDYVPFQDMAGTSSLDFGFEGPKHGYPYHSCYETFEWMEKFGDPGGLPYHRALAQIWALLILEIADRPLLPFDLRTYADAIAGYVESLKDDIGTLRSELDLSNLTSAAASLKPATETFHAFEDLWATQVLGRGGLESNSFAMRRLEYNARMSRFETDLLDIPVSGKKGKHNRVYGIPGREQFKHVIFGPQAWGGSDTAYFPAVRDAVAMGHWTGAQERIEIAAEVIRRAGKRLVE